MYKELLLYILLFTFYVFIFVHTIQSIRNLFIQPPDPIYYHPFDQWRRRKENYISPWYQDYLFDSKRSDNLFPSYQNI